MKVRAQLTASGLAIGSTALSLDRLSSTARDSVGRLPKTVLIEVELDGDAVVALGDVLPHPRVAALRAVQDARPHDALAAIAELGPLVEDDLEVRVAEISALLRGGFRERSEAAFVALTSHGALDRKTLELAFVALSHDARSVTACTERFLACFERLLGDEVVVCPALRLVPFERWPTAVLARALDEGLNEKALSTLDVEHLEPWARRLAGLDAERGRRAQERLDALHVKLQKAEARRRAKTLAARPDFTTLPSLPEPLRVAWHRAYEDDNRLCFLLVKHFDELAKLSARLVEDLEPSMPRRAEELLPFAHDMDERYFVLDLSRPTDGDFPVLVICKDSGGDAWENSPSSAAWLADGGALHF